MTETINPKTGLLETPHAYYGIPHVQQRGLGSLKFNGQRTAVHTAPIGNGLTLDFYASLGRSDEIVVTLMGATPPEKNTYPKFSRIRSVKPKAPAFMAFADPTMLLDPNRRMNLSWYLGGPDFDPAPMILKAIRRAKGKTGAKHVAFIGGSGGGYVALRLSALVPGSMAFVQNSATNISQSRPNPVARYFDTVWDGWEQDKLLKAFPERFDMVRHYSNSTPDNFVYYAQSNKDSDYEQGHYAPFRNACGVTSREGVSRDGSRQFAIYDAEVEGHGQITRTEFDHHYAAAFRQWRSRREALESLVGEGTPKR